MKNNIYRYCIVALGSIIMGISINTFFVQHNLLSGGITGIAVMLYYLFNLPIGITSFILNIPLFFVAYRYMNREFFIITLFGTVTFSLALDMLSFLSQITYVQNPLLSCVAGGVLSGIGAGIVYRVGGSTGGTDILGFIVNKYYSISISATGFIINVILMAFGAYLFGLEPALYSMVLFFISFKTANLFADGFDYKKNFIIISEHSKEIGAAIIQVVGRGVTYLHAEGAYTHQERMVVFVVVKLTQVAQIRNIIKEIDPYAFVIIQDATDVLGRGFTQASSKQKLQNDQKKV